MGYWALEIILDKGRLDFVIACAISFTAAVEMGSFQSSGDVDRRIADLHPRLFDMASLIPSAFRPFRLALIQLATTADKQSNLRRARALVKEACTNGANVVVLPVRPLSNPFR